MFFPLGFWDLSLWLAATATILITASELLSPRYGKINIIVNMKRLKNAGLIVSFLFLITVVIRITGLVTSP